MNEGNEVCCQNTGCAGSTSLTVAQATPVERLRPHYTSRYDEASWEVAVRLPGAKKEDVTVTVENEVLEVAAVRRRETPGSWRPLGDYASETHWQLRLDVGPEVDGARITGSLEDGVLTLRLPLREEVKPRRIEIQ
jgi:HSP20 family protein